MPRRPDAFNIMMNRITRDLTKEQREQMRMDRAELREAYDAGFKPSAARTEWNQRDSVEARKEWFNLMNDYGYDISDFPWESWRENYKAA